VTRIEAAVEAQLNCDAGALDLLGASVDPRETQIDGLLAEHRLPGGDCTLDVVGVRVGGCRDKHRIDVTGREYRVGRIRGSDPISCRNFFGERTVGIVN
jgi:hypothetical protein